MKTAPLDVEGLYDRHHRMVRRRVRRFVGPGDVDDVVQEVFERAIRHRESFHGRSTVVSWLYQIATRVCLHRLRDHQRRDALIRQWGVPAWGQSDLASSPEASALLTEAWDRLEEDHREIGLYHLVDGLTQAEIARVCGCSRQTVGNRLSALRIHLREALVGTEESA